MKVVLTQQAIRLGHAGAHALHRLDPAHDVRASFGRAFPSWLQPAITWISGKSLPSQLPLMPLLCTPLGKVLAAAWTLSSGISLGLDALRACS